MIGGEEEENNSYPQQSKGRRGGELEYFEKRLDCLDVYDCD